MCTFVKFQNRILKYGKMFSDLYVFWFEPTSNIFKENNTMRFKKIEIIISSKIELYSINFK